MSERDEAAKAFALELVQLARKHGANRLVVKFDMSGHTPEWRERDEWDHGEIELVWSEGRHAAKARMSLSYRSTVSLLEAEPADV